jgi:hypothetical protein
MRRSHGFTLTEMAISCAVLVVMGGAVIEVVEQLGAIRTSASTATRLQEAGERALLRIVRDLARSGTTVVGGKSYPHVFADGDAAAAFDNHDHTPADQHGEAGDPDFGPSREIVFLAPADADGDGVPDLDPDGALVWDAAEFSYVLVTVNGVNELQRRTDAANAERVARDVERVVFDDAATDPTLTADSVRVRLWMRAVDGEGIVQRYLAQAVVRLRNG